MPKIKMISRNPDEYMRETKRDIHKVPRNYDPSLHPFEAPREYTRALNAAKLERVFAKPFLGSLDGHRDGVHQMTKHPKQLSLMLSGACDGEVKVWNLPKRKCMHTLKAHDGFVRGMCFHPSGDYFFSCGDDKTVKQWSIDSGSGTCSNEPMNTVLGKGTFHHMDHHWSENVFATSGDEVSIWQEDRSEPLRTFKWGVDSIHHVKFNPVESHILAAAASDRGIMLYDMRGATPLRKVILKLKSNAIAWNPMEAFVFTVANEDYNLYTFDMRKLDMPLNVHQDHVSAVLDVDYSPTGKEFVSGSYDKTIRIFPVDKGHSREVYHTKRMQRVECVRWSLDNKYLLSGSDEMNVRVWKAKASEKLGVMRPRERVAQDYNEKLKEKFAHHPKVKRIVRHRHIPKAIYSASKEHKLIHFSKKRKESNIRTHSKPGAMPHVPERKKHVLREES